MLPARSSSGWRSSRGSPKLSKFPRVPEQLLEARGYGVNPPTGCSEVTRSLPNGIWGGSTGAELRERKPSGQPGESGLREGKGKARRRQGEGKEKPRCDVGGAAVGAQLLASSISPFPASAFVCGQGPRQGHGSE